MQHVRDERVRLWLKVRIGLIATVFAVGFLAVASRVYYLQTVESEALQERTAVQRDREVTRQARRGDILDRNGMELAVSVEVPDISVRPNLILDPQREARRLAPILDRPVAELVELLDSDRNFVWLKRQARPSTAEAVAELEIRGIEITPSYKRYYPMRTIAGQLLGFVGIDGDGLEGLERQCNEELAGGTYSLSVSRDARGRAMLLADAPQFGEFEGNNIHLTIDEKIQSVAQDALTRQIEEHNAKGGYAVVMDVNNGDVLAMANHPEFDPNRLNDYTSGDWRLRGVTDTFEPGSVFKPFLLAAALQEQTTTLDKVYDLENGRMRIGGYTIGDTSRHDDLTAAEIIQKSSNIGSYKMAREMGRETFYDYLRNFGFGSRTGITLRGEQPGLLWPPDRWAEITFANVAFGQGMTATPLQLITATSVLANGGMLLQPRIIDEIRSRDGQVVHRDEPTMVRRVISPEVAQQVAWAMSLVTIEGGTGQTGAIEHFTVAAKTGTAQKVDPETRRYDPNGWVSGYIGFAPAERPEIAVVVFIDEPVGRVHYGGLIAGPAFQTIMREALSQRSILPLPAEERFQLGEEPPTAPRVDIAPLAPEHMVVLPTMRVFEPEADVPEGERRMPDFSGLTMRQSVDRARSRGLSFRTEGWGRVESQTPAPGTELTSDSEVFLTLSPGNHHGLISEEPYLGEVHEEN